MEIKQNKLFLLILILILHITSSTLIKIPFKINQAKSLSSQSLEKAIEDMSFNYKLFSLIEIGKPPQKIETVFDIKMSNYFITNTCRDCLSFYSYKKSDSFSKTQTEEKPFVYGSTFYANETFYFYDEKNKQKEIGNMLIFLPELKNDNKVTNCLNIGLKFPDYSNNNFQESFIQQLKHKNIINNYFWTMIFNESSTNNNVFDGYFIFGDIFNDYYRNIEDKKHFSYNKIVHTYTGKTKKKNSLKEENVLEWGLQFDEIYYINSRNNLNKDYDKSNKVFIQESSVEFDININVIFGATSYYNNIIKDYFDFYLNNNICKESFMRMKLYKFIYCNAKNFTKNDLENFPPLNFKNNILRFNFILDYKDLFSLTNDKKFYIFNVMTFNLLHEDNNEKKWVFGLTFWKKYQFVFDSDNKLIYFYNKYGKFIDEIKDEMNENNKNINKGERYIFLLIIFILIVIFLFSILLIKKILIKKGYTLIRFRKANELIDEYDYSNKNVNDNKNNSLINQECEMQIKETKVIN